jgi:hypothetical protein
MGNSEGEGGAGISAPLHELERRPIVDHAPRDARTALGLLDRPVRPTGRLAAEVRAGQER